MKYFTLIFITILLIGCSKPVNEWTTSAPQPIPGTDGCTYQRVDTGEGSLQLIRCPSASTASVKYSCGKGCQRTDTTITQDQPTTQSDDESFELICTKNLYDDSFKCVEK